MRFHTLAEWLAWQETLHPRLIDPGLERVAEVLGRMDLHPAAPRRITVGGTNGKGSCVAMLDAILRADGYRTGAYFSPHVHRYNERIIIDGEQVTDDALCESFARVDAARGDCSLSYFEFGTLAAFDCFNRAQVEVELLEVGLGGRLDAVNVVDADVALVTTVDLDHQEWLGDGREAIGYEKAGIFRPHRAAVYGGLDPPRSLVRHATEIGSRLYVAGKDFGWREEEAGQWSWWSEGQRRRALPRPGLRSPCQMQNAAGVLMVLEQLSREVPVGQAAIRMGLEQVRLPGRLEVIPGDVTFVLDVAHNPQAGRALNEALNLMSGTGTTRAVLGVLAGKDVAGLAQALREAVNAWYIGAVEDPRRAEAEDTAVKVRKVSGASPVEVCDSIPRALDRAREDSACGDRVVVLGSFVTVAEASRALGKICNRR